MDQGGIWRAELAAVSGICRRIVLCLFCSFFLCKHISALPVDRAGLERTEAGESAPSRHEDSPRPGRTKCELYETLQDLIMGAGKEASINLPCLLILASSWTASPSHSYSSELQAKGGHCAARPSCLSDGVRDRKEWITWSCATKRSCFRPFYELPLQRSS